MTTAFTLHKLLICLLQLYLPSCIRMCVCVSFCVCVSVVCLGASADEPVGHTLDCLLPLQRRRLACRRASVRSNCKRQSSLAACWPLVSVRMEPLQASAWAALSLEVLGEVVLCVSEYFITRGTGLPAFQLVCRSWLQAASQSITAVCSFECRSSWHLHMLMNMQDHQSSICSYVRQQLICRLVQYLNSIPPLEA